MRELIPLAEWDVVEVWVLGGEDSPAKGGDQREDSLVNKLSVILTVGAFASQVIGAG